jgi:hypothetical protein
MNGFAKLKKWKNQIQDLKDELENERCISRTLDNIIDYELFLHSRTARDLERLKIRLKRNYERENSDMVTYWHEEYANKKHPCRDLDEWNSIGWIFDIED